MFSGLCNRQDLRFDGCVPLFMNGDFCLEFLRGYIDCPKSENKLDKSLYTTMCANEFKAGLRANVLWKYNRTSVGHRSDTDRTVPDTDRTVTRASLSSPRL